jgi:hypothetical protein
LINRLPGSTTKHRNKWSCYWLTLLVFFDTAKRWTTGHRRLPVVGVHHLLPFEASSSIITYRDVQ